MDEDDLFAQEMGLVLPIRDEKKRIAPKKAKKHAVDCIVTAKEALFDVQLHQHRNAQVKTTADWQLCASGVDGKTLKKLAHQAIQHELDLHGLSQAQALDALDAFMQQTLAKQMRYMSIIHGKGLHSQDKPILKSALYHWLEHGRFSSMILAAVPAAYSKGGACHILLRRNQA